MTRTRIWLAWVVAYSGMLWLRVGGDSAAWFCHLAVRIDPDFADHHDAGWMVKKVADDYVDGMFCGSPVGDFLGSPVGCMRSSGHEGECTYFPTVEMIQDDAGWPADHPLRRAHHE